MFNATIYENIAYARPDVSRRKSDCLVDGQLLSQAEPVESSLLTQPATVRGVRKEKCLPFNKNSPVFGAGVFSSPM